MEITFRQATSQDIDILKSINYTSFEVNADFDPYIDMDWVHSDAAHTYFTDAVTKEQHYTLIAEVDGTPAGYIILHPKIISYRKAKTLEIGIIAVLPQYRSGGIGSQLVGEAKKWAKDQGYDTLFVNSYIGNERALKFYKHQGFSPIDISLETDL